MKLRLYIIFFLSVCCVQLQGHEIKPGYLEITQSNISSNNNSELFNYKVQWKSPIQTGRPLPVEPRFPVACKVFNKSSRISGSGAFVSRLELTCTEQLQGQVISLRGLEATRSDVLIRFQAVDQAMQTKRVSPEQTEIVFQLSPTQWQVAQTYLLLGMEHILSGIDHLLFVLGLMLLITGFRTLLLTITAFTIAHSLTLIATSLGWISIPAAPVEAVIALSIVFLANEIALKQDKEKRLSERKPWIVAFVFGLLHGFGFAGALTDIGLPEGEIPIALLSFNIGVELGQVVFVCLCTLALFLINKLKARLIVDKLASYAIGISASFWLLQRLFIT